MKTWESHRVIPENEFNTPQQTGVGAWVARIVLIMLLLGYLFLVPKPANAETQLYRDTTLVLPVDVASESAYVVMLDEIDATAFATPSDKGIEFVIPFPKKRTAFQLSVVNAESRETVYQQDYRKAGALEVFDNVEVQTSGQIDSAITMQEMPEPRPLESFQEYETKANLRAAVTLRGERKGFDATLDVEAVNHTAPDATLRIDGPNADISRFAIATQYRHESGHRVYLNAGDAQWTCSYKAR